MSATSSGTRKILLRVMLSSLALAAAAGILGVLSPGTDLIWRLVGTAVMTSVGCALLMAASRFIEKPELRVSSMAGMSLVLVEYLLGLLLLWGPHQAFFGSSFEEAIVLTMLVLAGIGAPAVAVSRLLGAPDRRFAGIVGLILLGLSLALLLIGTWIPVGSSRDSSLLGCGWVMELYSILAILCLVGAGAGDRRYWRWVGVVSAAIACGIAMYGIVMQVHGDAPPVFVWSTVIAVVVAHANISLYASLSPGLVWLRWATIAAVATTAVLVAVQVLADQHDELMLRLCAAAGICAACGSMAMAIIARMNKKPEREMIAPAEITQINVTCPGCQKKQAIPIGDSACIECGLRFSIKIDEPRCETCGYLLYRLKSDRCPECGTPIRGGVATIPS